MKDYEQLYYDLLIENRKLKQRIEELESDLEIVNKRDKKKINLKKEILKELRIYKKGVE
jgi:cell division septum initiation protein DivIVA